MTKEKEMKVARPKIEIIQNEDGFGITSRGYSEEFLIKLVATLKGTNVNTEMGNQKESVPHTEEHTKEPKVANTAKEPSKVNTFGTVAVELPESFKERLPQNNTEKVYEDVDSKSTLADKFGAQARQLYELAGVKGQDEEKPDYYHTGIKINQEGNPRYRLHYSCPKCGKSGRHYIPPHIKNVSCHECLAPLVVEPATDKGFDAEGKYRDEFGNFFVARVLNYSALNKN